MNYSRIKNGKQMVLAIILTLPCQQKQRCPNVEIYREDGEEIWIKTEKLLRHFSNDER